MRDQSQEPPDIQPRRTLVQLPADQTKPDTHVAHVGGIILPAAIALPEPEDRPLLADLPLGHFPPDIHRINAEGDLPADHPVIGIPNHDVGGNQPSGGQMQDDIHSMSASGSPHDALLLILADALDDLERARIATQNRLRSLAQVKGLEDSREARTMQTIADTLAVLEHKATLDLQRVMRAHPLGPWVKRTIGIGEKQGARLLAAIGDPADRRMPSQLWQYCGHGAPSKRRRGEKTFWNPTAKMRLHLIAESCIKQTGGTDDASDSPTPNGPARRPSPYRAVYDEARMDWADRDTSDGHKHNHALRMVGKAILLDLWREAHALREVGR